MKKVFVLIAGIIFLFNGLVLAQNVIDFENMTICVDMLATYQATTPFFPGVMIKTIDNKSGAIISWPIVVRSSPNPANPPPTTCLNSLGLTIPYGESVAFRTNICGSNKIHNYPVPSGYNSLSKGSADAKVTDGYVIFFDYPIKDFSAWFADWGDWFPVKPAGSTDGYIKLIAYDEFGTELISAEGIKLIATDINRDAAASDGFYYLGLSASNIRKVEIRFMGFNDPGVSIDNISFKGELNVDIKPGSYPNCFNSNEHGVIPVAILGSADLDVYIIDPSTVELNGQAVRVKGKSGNAGSYEDVNRDGFIDLVVRIEDDGVYAVGNDIGTIMARSYDGVYFEGQDSICITR